MAHRAAFVPFFCLVCLAGCDDGSEARDPKEVASRLPSGSEAIVRPFGGADETHLKGLVEDATLEHSSRGRGQVKRGTVVVVVDDSMVDLHNNIPGSRDVAVRLKNGGEGGKPVFIARTDLRAKKAGKSKPAGKPRP